MERLTTTNKDVSREMICRNEDCGVKEEHCPHLMEDECACLRDVINKLAKYEDLEKQCIEENQCGLRELLLKWKEFFDDIAELYDYRKAEEQGLLKMLPCRVGDTVYVSTKTIRKSKVIFGEKKIIFEDAPIPEYVECKVVGISFKNKGNYIKVRYTGAFEEKYYDDEIGYDYRIITDSIDTNYTFSSIGKTVFLTEKEAEAALVEKGE